METFTISSASIGADIRTKILHLRCRNNDIHELFGFVKAGLEFDESGARETEFIS